MPRALLRLLSAVNRVQIATGGRDKSADPCSANLMHLQNLLRAGRVDLVIEHIAALVEQLEPLDPADHPLWVPYRGSLVRLNVGNVRRISAERDYVRIYDAERSYLFRATLSDIAAQLTGCGFIRIHRSTIIAFNQIAGVRHVGGGSWAVIDCKGDTISIGRTYLADLRAALFENIAARSS